VQLRLVGLDLRELRREAQVERVPVRPRAELIDDVRRHACQGDLRALSTLRFRLPWLLAGALLLQVLVISVFPGPRTTLRLVAYLGSYGLAVVFLVLNRSTPGFWLIATGAFLNLVAIAANTGVMPATRGALATAGVSPAEEVFANSAYVTNARVWFLGDVFAIPASWPLANVFSVGDILIALGAAWAILATTRRGRDDAPGVDPPDPQPAP
jgi:hypothetical protein